MHQLMFFFFSICLFVIMYKSTKGSQFQINIATGRIWALILYKDFVLILLPILFLTIYDPSDFHSMSMTSEYDILDISIVIVFSLLVFYALILIFYKLFDRFTFSNISLDINNIDIPKLNIFCLSFLLTGTSFLIISIIFFNYKHAFFETISGSSSLLSVRLSNVYQSNLPSSIQYVMKVTGWVIAIYVGMLISDRKLVRSAIIFTIGLLICSAGGAKGPIVQYFMLIVMSLIYFRRPKLNFIKTSVYSSLYLLIISFIIFYIVSIQFSDINFSGFIKYLFERIGVGQMSGTYETLSTEFYVKDSWWHMVPFADEFVDYPVFSKELMIYSEGVDYYDSGVKNSFFIAEAYGMGGEKLLFVSPFIMAFAYILKMALIYKVLSLLYGSSVCKVFTIPLTFLSTSITGDLSSMVFQKGTILIVFVLVLVYFAKLIIENMFWIAKKI